MAIQETTASLLSRDIKNKLLDENIFWVKIQKLIDLITPIIKWLDKFQSNKPVIHKVFSAFDEIKTCLTEQLPLAPITKNEETRISKAFEDRMDNAGGKIHMAASILNPASQGDNLEAS